MKLAEYSAFDALGLADLVARKQVTPKELAQTAAQAIEKTNPTIKAVVETYADRIDDWLGLDRSTWLQLAEFALQTGDGRSVKSQGATFALVPA